MDTLERGQDSKVPSEADVCVVGAGMSIECRVSIQSYDLIFIKVQLG